MSSNGQLQGMHRILKDTPFAYTVDLLCATQSSRVPRAAVFALASELAVAWVLWMRFASTVSTIPRLDVPK